MSVIAFPMALAMWVTDHLRTIAPEIVGGFVAYFLHQTYHAIWKRPAHFLLRLIFRSTKRSGGH